MAARWSILCVLAAACNSDVPNGDDVLGGSRIVNGDVVDFQTAAPVTGAASVSTSGVSPAPQISTRGASFTIEGVPDNSAFQILASATPTHRPTFGPSVLVDTTDITGVKAPVVGETYLAGLATAFGVTPSGANGVLFGQLVDANDAPRAGIAGSNLVLAGGAGTPHFLDANLMPAAGATSSSASGWVVFFELPAGVVELGQAANATVTLAMPRSPVAAATVTVARIVVTDGAPPTPPTNISFATQIVPIFHNRGCVACHSGGGIGKDLGGLKLDGPASQVYSELLTENPARVVLQTPETSLVLTRPSLEAPPDVHPNVTFTSAADPDYIKLLVWIREGARNN